MTETLLLTFTSLIMFLWFKKCFDNQSGKSISTSLDIWIFGLFNLFTKYSSCLESLIVNYYFSLAPSTIFFVRSLLLFYNSKLCRLLQTRQEYCCGRYQWRLFIKSHLASDKLSSGASNRKKSQLKPNGESSTMLYWNCGVGGVAIIADYNNCGNKLQKVPLQ